MTTTAADLLDRTQIQGNVLDGFMKDHQIFAFFRISDSGAAKQWLAQAADSEIATCAEVEAFNALFSQTRRRRNGREIVKSTWMNTAFTASGLAQLGVPPDEIARMDPSFSATDVAGHAKTVLLDVNESDPANWKPHFRDGSVHVVVIIAADDDDVLDAEFRRITGAMCDSGFELIDQEPGHAREGEHAGHEHFGFKDGISQPPIAGVDDAPNALSPSLFILDVEAAPASPAQQPGYTPPPQPPPSGPPAWCHRGSYMVFRKLRQYVDRFENFVEDACPAHAMSEETFAAKVVGRYKSGAPLAALPNIPFSDPHAGDPMDEHPEIREVWNEFTYASDPNGVVMPLAAHIRKTNPRDELGADVSNRRILRRGIAYGDSYSRAPESQTQSAAAERGLLFVCYQASIVDQFEFIQQSWANAVNFPPGGERGHDPIIGQTQAGSREFVLPFENDEQISHVSPFVVTRGHVYAFQPSIDGLRQIATR